MAPGSHLPTCRTKEVADVELYRRRPTAQRLDVWPFFLLYSLVLVKASLHVSNYEWGALTFASYALGAIGILHVLTLLLSEWSTRCKANIWFARAKSLDEADAALVIPDKFAGSKELVGLERRVLREGLKEWDELGFEFHKQRFVYVEEKNAFEKLAFPTKDTFGQYLKATGHGTAAKAIAAQDKYGFNQFEVPVPAFMSLLKDHLVAPFFCFQVFCVLLWMLDEYWYYSLFTLFMLVTFECMVVQNRLRTLNELRGMATTKQHVHVYRCGKWELTAGEGLFPGDLISIGRPTGGAANEPKVVPADCLLLDGTCIAEEAVLTGESTPTWKVPVCDLDPNERLNIKLHKNHVLFSGTRILQHTAGKGARVKAHDGNCLAFVLRTGFETAQGRLMRTIIYSAERVTANSKEAGLFILFLLFFAIAAAWHVLSNGLRDPERDRFKLVLNCIMIVTSVIPPELPMELSMAVNASLVALAKKRIFCTEPFRIPFAGKAEVCCFDKTGTLTSDHLLLEEVVVPSEDKRPLAHRVMATCHSLVQVPSSSPEQAGEMETIGDPLETAVLEAVEWKYASDVARNPDGSITATILQRHHFSSNLKRMSAVLRVFDNKKSRTHYEAVMKGAPEVIKRALVSAPDNYDQLYKQYAAQGARVIALATRDLGSEEEASIDDVKSMPRDQVESGMTWAGFAVLSCPLKEDSEPALAQLRASSHQLVMITGDAPLTACYAASKVHIVTRDVLVLGHRSEEKGQVVHGPSASKGAAQQDTDDDYVWVSPDEKTQVPFSRAFDKLLEVASSHDLCVSGDALSYVHSIGLSPSLIPLCQVYARVSPEQKELIIKTMRSLGRTLLMCGDGTNDVGGLKAAHVGVALLSATESATQAKKQSKAKDKGGKGGKAGKGGNEVANTNAEANKKKPMGKGTRQLEAMRAKGRPVTPRMEEFAKYLDSLEEEEHTLKPGDASMASPFTAKASSVMPCTDIIKQGRCTLVTTIQMFKILGLLCLSTAFSLSVMYLQGVKMSDKQATLNGMLTAALFFFISQAKPLNQLSAVRPHPTIFNPYFFISLLGQFGMNLAFLSYMYHLAYKETPEEDRLKPDSEFKPNLVNSVTYMVEALVQLSTFTVNYMGHPFNNSIRENTTMFTVLKVMGAFLFTILFNLVPGLGESFGMVVIPMHIRLQLFFCGIGVLMFNYFLEHKLRVIFPARVPPQKGYMEFLGKGGRTQPKDKGV